MKVSTQDGKTFTLARENEADHQFIDAIDFHHCLRLHGMVRESVAGDGRAPYQNAAALIEVDSQSEASLRANAASQALGALGEVFSLGLAEAADDLMARLARIERYVQTHEQLSASLEELKTMLQSDLSVVVKQEPVVNELGGTHGISPVVEAAIVKE